jgi:hypothetical protein
VIVDVVVAVIAALGGKRGRGLGRSLTAICLALVSLRAEASELRVGVLPFVGSHPTACDEATKIFSETLGSLRGIAVVELANIDAVLPGAKQKLEACKDDPCLVSATSGIKTDGLAVGTLDDEAGRTVLRIRLVRTSSEAPTVARVTRDVLLEPEVFAAAVAQSALDLFPENAKASVGTLEVHGLIPGARIVVDGKMSASVPLDPIHPGAPAVLKLAPGSHQIRVSASGHYPTTERAQVSAGQRTRLVVDLQKNRSSGPLILAAIAGGAAITGAIIGGVAKTKADNWSEACAGGQPCAVGFTRERYDVDRGAIARERTVANALFGVGGAAAIGAVIWFFIDPGSDVEESE